MKFPSLLFLVTFTAMGSPVPKGPHGGPVPLRAEAATVAAIPSPVVIREDRSTLPAGTETRLDFEPQGDFKDRIINLSDVACNRKGDKIALLHAKETFRKGKIDKPESTKLITMSPRAGIHPLNVLLESQGLTPTKLSPDGSFVVFRDKEGRMGILDSRTGKKVDFLTTVQRLKVAGRMRVDFFSENSRYALLTDPATPSATVIYDLQKDEAADLPEGYRWANWISPNGQLLGAEDLEGNKKIINRFGVVLFPKGGVGEWDRISPSVSADGSLLALVARRGNPPVYTLRILQLPDGETKQTIELPGQVISRPKFSPDARLISFRHGFPTVTGNAPNFDRLDDAYVSVASVATGERLNYEKLPANHTQLDSCGSHGETLFYRSFTSDGDVRLDFFYPELLVGKPIYQAAKEKELLNNLRNGEPAEAYRAARALAMAGKRPKEVKEAIKSLAPQLTQDQLATLSNLETRLADRDFKTRDKAFREVLGLLQRCDSKTLESQIRPELEKAAKAAHPEAQWRVAKLRAQLPLAETREAEIEKRLELRLKNLE